MAKKKKIASGIPLYLLPIGHYSLPLYNPDSKPQYNQKQVMGWRVYADNR